MRFVLLVAALLLVACQQPPAPHPVTSGVSPVAQLRAEGDALMARGEYASAIEKYRQATDLEPASVSLRFALGIAYSFLDRRPEAIAQLQWVVSNASPESTESREARRWLVRVGALIETEPGPGSKAKIAPGVVPSEIGPVGRGAIIGKTEWSGLDPTRAPATINIALTGDEASTRSVSRRTRVALGEPYEFKDVPEGRYRLRGIFGEETIIWDQSVTVEAGKQADVLLTQAASAAPRHTFQQEPKSQP